MAKTKTVQGELVIDEQVSIARLAYLQPDCEKIHGFAGSLKLIAYPLMDSSLGDDCMDRVRQDIAAIAAYCEAFGA